MIKKIKRKLRTLIKSTYRGDKFFYHRNLNNSYNFSKQLVLIYSMGKVGSASIYESIKTHSLIYNIFHLHRLNAAYLKKRERLIKNEVYKNKKYLKGMYTDLLWTPLWIKKLLPKTIKPIKLITAVREPIGRNISLFFQWIDFEETVNSYSFKSRNNKYPFNITTPKDDLSSLYNFFLNSFTQDSHQEWLQNELKYVFHIDLLAKPFDREKGFSIYTNDKIQLLVLKLETLNSTFSESMQHFLDERIELIKINEASVKDIKSVYEKFKAEICFPKEYIDTLYSSAYVNHFYTPEEIEIFKTKWNTSPHG